MLEQPYGIYDFLMGGWVGQHVGEGSVDVAFLKIQPEGEIRRRYGESTISHLPGARREKRGERGQHEIRKNCQPTDVNGGIVERAREERELEPELTGYEINI